MEKSQLKMLAHLCQLFQDANISAIFKTNPDPEVETVTLYLKEIGGEIGSYQVRILDLDTSLEVLLTRAQDWSSSIVFSDRILSGNRRLKQRLPVGVWYDNQEVVTVRMGEEVFFLIITDIVAP